MSKRKLYPPTRLDRQLLWAALIFGVSLYCVIARWFVGPLGLPDLIAIALVVIGIWVGVYFQQDQPKDDFEDYTVVIANIEGISKQLAETLSFLKQEQRRVAESEATLRKLRNEKTQLEPIVLAQRDTVNAILAAHSKATTSRAWKERALGFMSGLFASLLAAMVFEYFKR
jgi:hypothetical protein